MRKILIALALLLAPALTAPVAMAKKVQAVFAGGCFWCMEHDMKSIPGVLSVESGYTGGKEQNPTYEQVSSHRTGHYEAVRIVYDDTKVTYNAILNRYWKLIDPTDDEGQFCDVGHQYRAAIFVTPDQKAAADKSKADLIASGKVRGQIVTQVLPLGAFWPAEEEHRNFAENNAARYKQYRVGCGRDQRLAQIWNTN